MSKEFKHALVVGKFAPLHLGHKYLIDTALENADKVLVAHYGAEEYGISSFDVFDKLVEIYGEGNEGRLVIICRPIHCEGLTSHSSEFEHRLGLANMIEGCKSVYEGFTDIDSVFSSETYGEPFAAFLSGYFRKEITHQMVDLDRVKYPVSATKIRNGELERSVWALM